MAVQIGTLFFQVTANTASAVASIASMNTTAKESANLIGSAMSKAFEVAAIAAGTAIASIVSGLAIVGAEFNIAGQKATGLFTALTGSAAEARDLMRQFAEISLESPVFSAKGLQDVSRTLLAYGVAKDDVVDLSIAINSTATALGVGTQGAERLALALGQVKARGFFSAEEARQLANYGVNAYQLIADAVGMTVSEVRQLGKEHKLLSSDVLPILTSRLQETFGPVAQNLVNTFSVQVQGLKNVFTGVASALVNPFIGRTGGGAIVDFLKEVRAELDSVVTVAEDGTFRLTGPLESLTAISQALADGFTKMGDAFVGAISGIGSGGGIQSFSDNVVKFIPILVDATLAFASGAKDFFGDLVDAAQPVYEPIKNLVLLLGDFVVNALPAAADAVVNFVDAVAPVAATLIQITDLLIKFASPIVVGVIKDLAGAFADLADVVDFLGGPLTVIYGVLGSIALLATSSGGLGILAVQGLALAFGKLAAQVTLALGVIATYKAVSAGLKGLGGNDAASNDFLYGDASNPVEGIFQKAARFGRGLTAGSGTVQLENDAHDAIVALDLMNASAKEVGVTFADSFKRSGLSMDEFATQLVDAKLSTYETAYATQEYRKILADIQQANMDAAAATDAYTGANLFEARVAKDLGGATVSLTGDIEDEIDVMKELKIVAKDAADALDDFLRPTADATVDDFFRSLPKIIEDATKAMKMPSGALKDLALGGALDDAKASAFKVIDSLVNKYGFSLEEIKALFDKRGLAGVIEAMGNITKETTKAVDPLIAKYGKLGATADQLRDAVARLNDQRQTAIKAQIDQVQAALTDAKQAAVDARQAITDFFTGGKGSNTQRLIDTLIGNVGDIGSKIEDGLKLGGEQGAAAIRLALGDVRGQLADIVSAGLEDGLSGQQIVDMLGPIGSVLQEQANQALNRISSLDFTEGFTPAAGAQISSLLSGLLDPNAIQKLISDALGADSNVSGLEAQLESLQAAAQIKAEFSPEQVQGALDAISEESKTVEVVTTPEAAQAIYDVIMGVLNDPSHQLGVLIDKDLIAKQTLEAAEEGARQTHLIFDSSLAFNEADLSQAGIDAANEFIDAFNAQERLIQDQYAQSLGFADANAMREALGSTVTNAMLPDVPFISAVNVNVNQGLTVDGNTTQTASSTERIAANSTAAGSTGTLSKSLQQIYGIQVIPGYRGLQ